LCGSPLSVTALVNPVNPVKKAVFGLKTPHQLKKYKAYEDLWFNILKACRKAHSEGTN